MAFWEQIAKGLLPEEAAGMIGVAQAVGSRWFDNAGGMPPFDLKFQPSGRYLSFADREDIAPLKVQGKGAREIARAIGRDPGTVSRELRRNAATRSDSSGYRASVAQWKADMAAHRPKAAKLVTNPRLHAYVQERLSGQISRPDGTVIAGIKPSTGAVGSSYDNALAESVIGLYKTELIKPRRPWKGLDDLEIATAEWVDWFNCCRPFEYCDDLTPVEAEIAHYAHHQASAVVGASN